MLPLSQAKTLNEREKYTKMLSCGVVLAFLAELVHYCSR